MIKRFNNYILNSMKVAILGFLWYGLFKFPWKSLVKEIIGERPEWGKDFCCYYNMGNLEFHGDDCVWGT